MSAAPTPHLRTALAACALLSTVAACGSTGGSGSPPPNAAGSATVVPGGAPTQGVGSSGGITVTGVSVLRSGSKLSVSGQIHNGESVADELVQVASEVTASQTVTPPVEIPAGATVSLGGSHPLVLDQNARLEPGGTVVLSLTFTHAGAVQVFSSFRETS